MNRPKNGGLLLVEQPECQHTPAPRGYPEWRDWAYGMRKTHKQERCPICGLWAIWKPTAHAKEQL